MSPIFVLIATAALGIEVGWEPLADGGHEYTIQIEPQLIDLLKEGNDEIAGAVPADIEVRRYRIWVGTDTLPRVAGPPRQPTRSQTAGLKASPRANSTFKPPGEPEAAASPGDTDENQQPPQLPPTTLHGADQDSQEHARASDAPARLPAGAAGEQPLETASFNARGEAKGANESGENLSASAVASALQELPVSVLLAAAAVLFCSMGANLYLGWIAWDARRRYRAAVAKPRAAPAI